MITSVTEYWDPNEANRDAANTRDYVRTFQVITNDLRDGPAVVGNSFVTGIPSLYSLFVDAYGNVDFGARVQKFSPKRRSDDPFIWDVTVTYNSRNFDRSPRRQGASGRSGKAEQAQKGAQDTNPLNAPTVIKIGASRFEKAIKTPLGKGAFVNFAREAFGDELIDDERIVVTMDKNQGFLNKTLIQSYKGALNSDAWYGFPPLSVKVVITAESAFEENLFYWKYTYNFEYRDPIDLGSFGASADGSVVFYQSNGSTIWPQPGDPNGPSDMVLPGGSQLSGWAIIKQNSGSYYLDANGNKRNTDDTGATKSRWLLDNHGNAQPTTNPPPVICIVFRGYKLQPFAALGVP